MIVVVATVGPSFADSKHNISAKSKRDDVVVLLNSGEEVRWGGSSPDLISHVSLSVAGRILTNIGGGFPRVGWGRCLKQDFS